MEVKKKTCYYFYLWFVPRTPRDIYNIYVNKERYVCAYIYIYTVYCRHRIWSSTLTELHPEIKKILWSRGSGAFAENHDRLVPVGPNVFHWRTVSCTSAFRKETNVTKSYTYFINHISSLYLPYQKNIHVGKQQIPFREKSIEIPSQKFTFEIPSRNKPSGLETLCLIEVTTIAWGMLVTLQPFLSTCHKTKLIEEIGKINSSSILKGVWSASFWKSKSKKGTTPNVHDAGKPVAFGTQIYKIHMCVPYGPNVCSWSHNGFWALILRSLCR